MKTRIVLLLLTPLFLLSGKTFAQAPDDCAITLSYFIEPAKTGNYEAALPFYKQLVKECPNVNVAAYQYAIRMFNHFIDNGDVSKVDDLIEAYKLRLKHFPAQTSEADVNATIAQLRFDYDRGTKEEQFLAFDKIFKKNPDDFTSAKGLYTYFSLAVDLFNDNKKDIQEIFDLYDVVMAKIDKEKNDLAGKLTPLLDKEEAGTKLNEKDQEAKEVYDNNLSVYGTIEGSVNGKLGQLADCPNLIPLYAKDFDAKKDDVQWIQNAMARLDAKECDDPLFFKLGQRLHELKPSSESAYYLGKLAEAEGKGTKALQYFNQAADLETDNQKKARIYYSIAENSRKKGSLGTARSYYQKMLEVRPSAGIAYYKIGQMYADSANSCGTDAFEKRAMYWLAADMMDKAARVDGSIATNAKATAENYRLRAPQKSDIFEKGNAGATIKFNCWVGGSVKVPNL